MSSKGGEEQDLLLGDVVHERASEVIKFIFSESKDGGNLSRHIIKDYGHDTDDNSNNLHPKKILYWQHHRASMFINYLLEVTTIPSHANASSFTLVLKSVQLGNMPTEAEEKVRPLSKKGYLSRCITFYHIALRLVASRHVALFCVGWFFTLLARQNLCSLHSFSPPPTPSHLPHSDFSLAKGDT